LREWTTCNLRGYSPLSCTVYEAGPGTSLLTVPRPLNIAVPALVGMSLSPSHFFVNPPSPSPSGMLLSVCRVCVCLFGGWGWVCVCGCVCACFCVHVFCDACFSQESGHWGVVSQSYKFDVFMPLFSRAAVC
jgi:hypothetical protein